MRKRYTFYLSIGCLLLSMAAGMQAAEQADLVGPSAAGAGKYVPQQWSVVNGAVINPGDQPGEFVAGQTFNSAPGVEFSRRIWVPAQSKRAFWLPVYPPQVAAGDRNIAIQGGLAEAGTGSVIDSTEGQLRVANVKLMTGVFEDAYDQLELDAIAAMRTSAGLKYYLAYMVDYKFPQVPEGWNALHSLMVSRNDISLSASQMESLRQWVFSGGKLWVLAEQADPDFMPELLADAWKVQVLDRVSLNDFELVSAAGSEKRSFDYPVEMIRVVAPDAQVIHRVGNWPASMTIQYGLGEVLVTTISARAWIDGSGESATATASLTELGKTFLASSTRPTVSQATMKHMIVQQVGSGVGPEKLAVVVVLAVVLLILALVVCGKTGQARQLKWVVPLIIIATLAGLYVVKGSQGSTQAPVMAGLQLIYTSSGLDHALVESQIGLNSAANFVAKQGGIAMPVSLSEKPAAGKITWADRGQWSISGADQSGVSCFSTQAFLPLSKPVMLSLPGGDTAEGRLALDGFGNASDMLLVTPAGVYKASVNADGNLEVSQSALADGQFASSNSDPTVAARRQLVVKEITSQIAGAGQMAMLVWVDPLDTAMNTDPGATSQVDALLIINVN